MVWFLLPTLSIIRLGNYSWKGYTYIYVYFPENKCYYKTLINHK